MSKNTKPKNTPPPKKGKAESVFTIDKKLIRLLSFVLIIFSFFLYINTLNHGYVLDDHSVIRENSLTKGGISSIGKIFQSGYRDGFGANGNDLYRPLSKVMFAIEWEIAPNNAKIGHLVNILLYSLTCFLLFIVLVRYIKINVYVLFVASLLFAAHPIHTEVVANIKSRDEILAMLFLLLSLLLISNYIANNKIISFIGSLVCFFLALLSKESAIVYVGIVFLVLHFFTETNFKKNAILTSAFAVAGITYIFIHIQIIGNLGIPNVPLVDNSLMGTAFAPSTFLEKKLTAVYILGKYLLLLFFPHPLSCDYSYNTIPLVKSVANPGFLLSLIVHAALLFYAFRNFKQKNIVAFSILFYFVSISITSNVFMIIGTNMAERLLYFPSVGFCLALAYVGSKVFKINFNASISKISALINTNKTMSLLVIAVTFIFSVKTFSRNKDWKSDGTLFNTDVEKVPNSAHMLFYTANHLMNKDSLLLPNKEARIAKAEAYIKKALKMYELFPDAHNVAARILYERKQFKEALIHYSRALQLNPSEVMNHNNIGSCYFNLGQYDKALIEYEKALKINPQNIDAQCNLGGVYGAMGEHYKGKNDLINAKKMFELAIINFEKTIQMDPTNVNAHKFLGLTYNTLGDTAKGKFYLDKAAQLSKK